MPGKGSGVPVGAPPRCEPQPSQDSEPAAHSHPTRVLLPSVCGVGVQCPEWDLVLPVGAPPRCEPESSQDSEPAAHSHPTRVLLRWIRGGDVWCRSTAPRCELGRHTFAPGAGAPTTNTRIRTRGGCSYRAKESDAYSSHLLRIIYSVIPFLGALLQQFFFILVHIVLSFLIILCMGTGST